MLDILFMIMCQHCHRPLPITNVNNNNTRHIRRWQRLLPLQQKRALIFIYCLFWSSLTTRISIIIAADASSEQYYRHHHDGIIRGRIRRTSTTTTSVGAFTPTTTHLCTKKPIKSKTTALQPKFKTFDEMLAQHHTTPILIDFYAPWCGPCKLMKMELKSIRDRLDELGNSYIHKYHHKKMKKDDDDMAKTLEEEEEIGTKDDNEQSKTSKRGGGIPVYHVNTNKFPQVGAKNNIHGLPTLVLFHEGTEIWRNEGIIRGEEIIKVLEERLLLQ